MKIAITSTGNTKESKMDTRFGRCTYFAIYDTEQLNVDFILNPNKESTEGAGPASVQLVASKGVKQIISGQIGGKVKSILESLQIQLILFTGPEKTVNEILELINNR